MSVRFFVIRNRILKFRFCMFWVLRICVVVKDNIGRKLIVVVGI